MRDVCEGSDRWKGRSEAATTALRVSMGAWVRQPPPVAAALTVHFFSPGSNNRSCTASCSCQTSPFSYARSWARSVCLSMAEGAEYFCKQPTSSRFELWGTDAGSTWSFRALPHFTAGISSRLIYGDLRPTTEPSSVPYTMSLTAVLLLRSNLN